MTDWTAGFPARKAQCGLESPRPIKELPMNRLTALTLLLLAAPAFAYRMEPDFFQVTEEYVSPHIPWAKPYAGGKVRALFIVPRYSVREIIELAERMDLDYQV